MIEIKNLTKTFNEIPVLKGLNLSVQKGSIYGLVGVNGAGKTTIINLLAGIYRQDQGEITIAGKPVFDNQSVKAKLGLIPDALWFPAGSNLLSMSDTYRQMYPAWNQEKFDSITELLHLDLKKHLRSFSKGMQKQAAFALVLAAEPDCLLLDEPMDGLDPLVRKTIWNLIIDAAADREMTTLVSSHNLRDLENMCDTIGIISCGTMKLEKALDDIKNSVYKVQLAFDSPALPKAVTEQLQILQDTPQGAVHLLIIRNPLQKIREIISRENPKIFDVLPLTLEEIFIYELGGDHDEVKEILV